MKSKLIKLLGLLTILMFIMACSLAGGGATQTPEEASAPESTDQPAATEEPSPTPENTPVAEASLCDNPYYPVREGSTWNYASTNTIADDYSFTDTITSILDDGFTLTTKFKSLTRIQEWTCTPAGIVAVELGGGLTAQSINLKIETQNASGVTYPKEINAGDTWQQALDFTGTMDIAGQEGEATGTTQSDFTAIGTESVTVPAGTFDAMKVGIETTININVNLSGITVPVTFTGTTTSWYVKDTGWVKSVSEGSFAGQSYTETVELQSYNIP